MRLSAVLLIVAAAFLATSTALSTEAGADRRLLRSHKTHHAAAAEDEEERGWFSSLPEQFKRMKNQPEFLRQTFHNWGSAFRTVDDAVQYMKSEGLKESDIEHFKKLYKEFLNTHRYF